MEEKRFSDIKILEEFINEGVTYGYYWVKFKGKNELLIRTGNKIAAACHSVGESPTKCMNAVRSDFEKEFLEALDSIKWN